ncbi:hypothetical protein Tcan_03252 [Toxocara canis]|uniref:Uncharacterized protein n=1 Tax=Toxocara canis TaxID=6265 RepID=A0A0B2VFF6_TOXCA|nr:hypothetical protein Tcan_03252 [Toxocara canis]
MNWFTLLNTGEVDGLGQLILVSVESDLQPGIYADEQLVPRKPRKSEGGERYITEGPRRRPFRPVKGAR